MGEDAVTTIIQPVAEINNGYEGAIILLNKASYISFQDIGFHYDLAEASTRVFSIQNQSSNISIKKCHFSFDESTDPSVAISILEFASTVLVDSCTFDENGSFGVEMYQSSLVTVSNNVFNDVSIGIFVRESNDTYIFNNKIYSTPTPVNTTSSVGTYIWTDNHNLSLEKNQVGPGFNVGCYVWSGVDGIFRLVNNVFNAEAQAMRLVLNSEDSIVMLHNTLISQERSAFAISRLPDAGFIHVENNIFASLSSPCVDISASSGVSGNNTIWNYNAYSNNQ